MIDDDDELEQLIPPDRKGIDKINQEIAGMGWLLAWSIILVLGAVYVAHRASNG